MQFVIKQLTGANRGPLHVDTPAVIKAAFLFPLLGCFFLGRCFSSCPKIYSLRGHGQVVREVRFGEVLAARTVREPPPPPSHG